MFNFQIIKRSIRNFDFARSYFWQILFFVLRIVTAQDFDCFFFSYFVRPSSGINKCLFASSVFRSASKIIFFFRVI